MRNAIFKITCAAAIISLSLATAAYSGVQKYPKAEVWGGGPLPYNYRVIDGMIHVGGHPLNPHMAFENSNRQALDILNYLKSKGVNTIIDLENTGRIQGRYSGLLETAGINRIRVPMHSNKVPTEEEWKKIKEAMEKPVYIHCKWGADRAGSIIARYLVEEKGYSPKNAWKAVISGGTHSGPIGGLKKCRRYRNLVLFFWPEAESDEDFRKYY